MFLIEEQWVRKYEEYNAYWRHDGNPKRPHALLTSGAKHSNGYFNSELVMEDSNLLDMACADLVQKLIDQGLNILDVDRVVGPAMGAITLADGVARHIGKRRDLACLRGYTEKVESKDGTVHCFIRTALRKREWILFVEDVITTGGSIESAAAGSQIAVMEVFVMPFVGSLVNRSGKTDLNGKKIVGLIDKPMPTWIADDCPLCAQDSIPIRPKGIENWAALNASY